MKLTYGEYGIELNILENQINILVAESPTFFSKLIETFCAEKRNGADSAGVANTGTIARSRCP